jgi:uncharacterized small protein (DUF1192 family)
MTYADIIQKAKSTAKTTSKLRWFDVRPASTGKCDLAMLSFTEVDELITLLQAAVVAEAAAEPRLKRDGSPFEPNVRIIISRDGLAVAAD